MLKVHAETRARLKELMLIIQGRCSGLSDGQVDILLELLVKEVNKFRVAYSRIGLDDTE